MAKDNYGTDLGHTCAICADNTRGSTPAPQPPSSDVLVRRCMGGHPLTRIARNLFTCDGCDTTYWRDEGTYLTGHHNADASSLIVALRAAAEKIETLEDALENERVVGKSHLQAALGLRDVQQDRAKKAEADAKGAEYNEGLMRAELQQTAADLTRAREEAGEAKRHLRELVTAVDTARVVGVGAAQDTVMLGGGAWDRICRVFFPARTFLLGSTSTETSPQEGEHCQSCGALYTYWWGAPDDLWTKVTGRTDGGGLRCIPCFTEEAAQHGHLIQWKASTETSPRCGHVGLRCSGNFCAVPKPLASTETSPTRGTLLRDALRRFAPLIESVLDEMGQEREFYYEAHKVLLDAAGLSYKDSPAGGSACRVCGEIVQGDGRAHLEKNDLDPMHADALSRYSWQSLIQRATSPSVTPTEKAGER